MHDEVHSDLAGAAFIEAIDAAFTKAARVRPALRLCAFEDPSASRFADVVVWRFGSMVFAFKRSSLTGEVTLDIGDCEVLIDESGPVPEIDVEDPAPGWWLLRSAGLRLAGDDFATIATNAGALIVERFDALFAGKDSILGRYCRERDHEALAELARAEAIEQAALVHEEWVSGIRVRELDRTPALIDLLDDAMPEPPSRRVWTVALPIGFIVCATREQAVGFATTWRGPDDD